MVARSSIIKSFGIMGSITTTQSQQQLTKQRIRIQSNVNVASTRAIQGDTKIDRANKGPIRKRGRPSGSSGPAIPTAKNTTACGVHVSSASRQAMEKLLLAHKCKASEMTRKEDESKSEFRRASIAMAFSESDQRDSCNRSTVATKRIAGETSAKFLDVKKEDPNSLSNCSSTVNNLIDSGNPTSEPNIVFKKQEKEIDTTQLDVAIINLFNIIAKNLPKPDFVLVQKPSQPAILFNFQSYVAKKTQMLLAKYSDSKSVYCSEYENDYFPADDQSILLFEEFFMNNENFLWAKRDLIYICLICKAPLKYKSSILGHLNVHYRHFHVCSICEIPISTLKALNRHVLSKHSVVL